MRKFVAQLSDLSLMLAVITLLFTAGRGIFYFYGTRFFNPPLSTFPVETFFSGVEYDLQIVLILNAFFVFLFFLPVRIYNSKFNQFVLKLVFFSINSIALIINLLDVNVFQESGQRISPLNFEKEIKRIVEDFSQFDLDQLTTNYLLILITAIIFILIIRSLHDFIVPRYLEKQGKKFNAFLVVPLIIALYSWFSYDFFNNKDVIFDKLYRKSSKLNSALVMNNPYLFLVSKIADERQVNDFSELDQFSPLKTNDSLLFKPVDHFAVFLVNPGVKLNAGETILNDDNFKFLMEKNLESLNGSLELQMFLDEAFLSVPPVFSNGIYQTMYSFNKVESLPGLLSENNFETSLFSVGYEEDRIKMIKNYYGFENYKVILPEQINGQELALDHLLSENDKNMVFFLIKGIEKDGLINLVNWFAGIYHENCMMVVFNFPEGFDENMPKLLDTGKIIYPPGMAPFINERFQLMDLKPSLLQATGYDKPLIAYGSGFSDHERFLVSKNKSGKFLFLKDSLLLEFSDNQTNKLLLLKNGTFQDKDLKDSLAVEKIKMENLIRSVFADYYYRLNYNELKN
ncbi:MAG: hypothetical protein U0W24_26345 [Bacteroidales bacterium]